MSYWCSPWFCIKIRSLQDKHGLCILWEWICFKKLYLREIRALNFARMVLFKNTFSSWEIRTLYFARIVLFEMRSLHEKYVGPLHFASIVIFKNTFTTREIRAFRFARMILFKNTVSAWEILALLFRKNDSALKYGLHILPQVDFLFGPNCKKRGHGYTQCLLFYYL